MGEWALILIVLGIIYLMASLTYITKLRRENRTKKKIIKYQRQIIEGHDKDH